MNSNEFIFWIQGLLEAAPSSSDYIKETIAKKLKDVVPVPTTYLTNTYPTWKFPVYGDEYKITCKENGQAHTTTRYAINLPNIAIGSNTGVKPL